MLALRDLLNSGAEGDYRCVYVNVEAAQAVREAVERGMRVIVGGLASRSRLLGDGFLYDTWTDFVACPLLLTPALFVVVTVLCFNFLGDGLRDAADPYK